jgi:hypothetical protein
MREDNEIVSHPRADRWSELGDCLLAGAEKELSAFVRAVEEIFGAEQACVSTTDWIEELELIDWPDGAAPPNWREVTIRASARLAAFRSEAVTTIGTDKSARLETKSWMLVRFSGPSPKKRPCRG